MKRSLSFAVCGGSAFVVTLVISFALLLRKQPPPPPPPVFSVKVGVLEDRKPSPNSRVWALAENTEAPLIAIVEARMEEMRQDQRRIASLFEQRATYKKLYQETSNVFNDATMEVFNNYQRNMLALSLAENDQNRQDVLQNSIDCHKLFIKRMESALDKAFVSRGTTGMEGTATLSDLPEPNIILYVIPALPDKFTFSRKALDLKADHEIVVELQKLPSTFGSP